MKKVGIIVLLFLIGLLGACQNSSDRSESKESIVVAKKESPIQKFYYSGVLDPLTMQSILSPVEGRVAQLYFSYGQFVRKGQPLLAINSNELTQEYRKSISDYLEKKTTYDNSTEEFRGSQALYNAGVISREEFINSRTQYRTNQLNYYQSRYEMEKILRKTRMNPNAIERLTLEDTMKVDQVLQKQFKHIVIYSPADGIALFPIENRGSSSDDNSNKKLDEGVLVKQDQLLLTVGNLQGLSTHILVDEININRIERGMPAIVTVNAFPNIELKATVTEVSSQAQSNNHNAEMSQFPVLINIPTLTSLQRQTIRVGMTARVVIVVHQPPTILLPIDAVFEKQGQTVVTTVSQFGRRKTVPVMVGFTTPTQISIIKGIQPGDRVVVPKVRSLL